MAKWHRCVSGCLTGVVRINVQETGDRLKFYSVKKRESVEVDDREVELVTMKNGRKAAQAELDGGKLFKILSADDVARLEALETAKRPTE